MKLQACLSETRGFSLIETMIALSILASGLLAAGQLLYIAAGSGSLGRSKTGALLAAQGALESLGDLYRQNPLAADLTPGNHGPRRITLANPNDGNALNRFDVSWEVGNVPDPRPGVHLNARSIRITASPVGDGGATNSRPGLNKILNLSTVFSQETR